MPFEIFLKNFAQMLGSLKRMCRRQSCYLKIKVKRLSLDFCAGSVSPEKCSLNLAVNEISVVSMSFMPTVYYRFDKKTCEIHVNVFSLIQRN